jgi:hemerythrin-like domain-containing protein
MSENPIDRFVREHQETLERLEAMEQAAEMVRSEGITEKRLRAIRDVVDWLDSDEVRRHNRREEQLLFSALEEAIPGESPTLLLREEHLRFWDKLDLVREWIDRAEAEPSSPEAAAGLGRAAGLMGRLMHQHIAKENEVLLPLTRHILGEVRLRALMGDLAGAT